MPIQPKFSLKQDNGFVYLIVAIPYVRAASAEVVVDDQVVTFFCKPYLLRLRLPGPVENDEHDEFRAVYDPNTDNGTITLHLPKCSKGADFKDLDLISTLLCAAPKSPLSVGEGDNRPGVGDGERKLIEVISDKGNSPDETDTAEEGKNEEMGQLNSTDDALKGITSSLRILDLEQSETTDEPIYPYGFNDKYSEVFSTLREEFFDLIELPEPEKTPFPERRVLREAFEQHRFDAERYMGDFAGAPDDPIYIEAMAYRGIWDEVWAQVSSTCSADEAFLSTADFSDADRSDMASLGRGKVTTSNLSSSETARMVMAAADIIFAYCYDRRITDGDGSIESAYNIARISATLSWTERFDEGEEHILLRACARRSLCYPYLRVWKLTRKVFADVVKVLLIGKRMVLRILLDVRRTFEQGEQGHYLLNKVYMSDLCIWAQGEHMDDVFRGAGRRLNEAKGKFSKEAVGFDIDQLEEHVLRVQREEEEEESSSSSDSSSYESSHESDVDENKDDDENGDDSNTVDKPKEEKESSSSKDLLALESLHPPTVFDDILK